MRAIEGVVALALLAAGCGGASTRSQGDETGAPEGGTTSSGGGVSGGAVTAGASSGGAADIPQPVDLGDGEHPDDGRPVIPTDSTGGFFWRACGETGWRLGNWFVTSDQTHDAFLREIDPPREGSTQARGATGSSFAEGAVLWVQLDHPSNRALSLSSCSALSFWARLESPSDRLVVALNDGSLGSGLLSGRWTLPSRTLNVGPDWQNFVLPFESFGDLGADTSVASIELFVGDGGESFDLWIDDLSLMCASDCP
jgi:hypothetical protein